MTKAIIFDLWGTLVETGVWSPIKQVRNILGIRMPFSEYVVRMERAMMTKEFPSLKEAFESVCKEFQINCPEYKMENLIGTWNKSWMLAKPYQDVEEELTKLKEKYTLILACNSDAFSVPKVLEKFNLGQYFEKKYFSFETNFLKTDESFLRNIINELGLTVEDCVFVGDSLQSDIKAAEKVGMKAVLIDRKNKRDYKLKINNLKELEKELND